MFDFPWFLNETVYLITFCYLACPDIFGAQNFIRKIVRSPNLVLCNDEAHRLTIEGLF